MTASLLLLLAIAASLGMDRPPTEALSGRLDRPMTLEVVLPVTRLERQ